MLLAVLVKRDLNFPMENDLQTKGGGGGVTEKESVEQRERTTTLRRSVTALCVSAH